MTYISPTNCLQADKQDVSRTHWRGRKELADKGRYKGEILGARHDLMQPPVHFLLSNNKHTIQQWTHHTQTEVRVRVRDGCVPGQGIRMDAISYGIPHYVRYTATTVLPSPLAATGSGYTWKRGMTCP